MNKNYEKILIENIEDYDSNLRGIELEYIKNGITIIIGENNVGKTNLLNWIFKNVDKLIWKEIVNPFLEVKVHQKNLGKLNQNFINSSVIFQYPSRRKIFYSIYYLDSETSFYNFLPKKAENSKKIKYLEGELVSDYFAEVEINRRLGKQEAEWKDWIEEFAKATKQEKKLDIIIEEAKEVKAINAGKLHSAKKTGSGNWKFWILKNFLHVISESNNKNKGITDRNPHTCQSILLIDEPELFLHDYWIKVIANSIKEGMKNGNLTIILATHSAEFISHFNFVSEDSATSLAIVQKESKGEMKGYLKNPLYFEKIIDKIRESVKEEYEKYAKESEVKKIEDLEFYKKKWKRLINRETLKIPFARKILFVEGPIECILLNNILGEKLGQEIEEKCIEIIPIFGKLNYAFFVKLAEKLIPENYWFMLDDDKRIVNGEIKWAKNEKLSNEKFWNEYGKDKNNEEDTGITHSRSSRISWIHSNIEDFLGTPPAKEDRKNKIDNIFNKEEDVIKNLEKNPKKFESLKKILSFLKKDE